MRCPKCGKNIEILECSCGWDVFSSLYPLCFIGNDAKIQTQLFNEYVIKNRLEIDEKCKEFNCTIEEGRRYIEKYSTSKEDPSIQCEELESIINNLNSNGLRSSIEELLEVVGGRNLNDGYYANVEKELLQILHSFDNCMDELSLLLNQRKEEAKPNPIPIPEPTPDHPIKPSGTETNPTSVSGERYWKRWLIIAAALVIVSGALGAIKGYLDNKSGGGWGDSGGGRPSYTLEEINDGILGDTITFNSISDGEIGDEKNFVAVKVAGETVEEWNANSINVKAGQTYTVRMYVHNDNPNGYDAVANEVTATFSLPTSISKEHDIIGYLDSSNAQPTRCWDGVTLKAKDDFYLEYVEGSAKLYTNELDGTGLEDEIISSGAKLGYDSLDGRLPGGYEYSGVVTIDVTVHKASWGPEDRSTYTMDSLAQEAVFNSITDNPTIGDERDFVRIGEITSEETDLDLSAEIEKGKQYLVYIYVHNNASATYNDKEHNFVGVATKTRLSTIYPKTLSSGEKSAIRATITAENTNPQSVWDIAEISTNEDSVSLKYVKGSAKIYNDWDTNNTILSTSLFTNEGTLLGLKILNGIVPGGEEYHSVVTYVLKAE